MSNLKLTSVKLLKKGANGLEFSFNRVNDIHSAGTEGGTEQVHPDLYAAIQKLAPHYGILNGWMTEKDIANEAKIKKFEVTGYIIHEKGDSATFKITGYHTGPYGVSVTNTPPMTLDKAKNPYSMIGDVNKTIKAIEKEALKYIEEGKKAQQTLDLKDAVPADKVTKMKIDNDETPKGEKGNGKEGPGGVKKVPQSAVHKDGTAKE